MYICTYDSVDYYVNFDKMVVLASAKNSRITETIKIYFDDKSSEFFGATPDLIKVYLLPLYSTWLDKKDTRDKVMRVVDSISRDLDDDACRNFNPFTGKKGA